MLGAKMPRSTAKQGECKKSASILLPSSTRRPLAQYMAAEVHDSGAGRCSRASSFVPELSNMRLAFPQFCAGLFLWQALRSSWCCAHRVQHADSCCCPPAVWMRSCQARDTNLESGKFRRCEQGSAARGHGILIFALCSEPLFSNRLDLCVLD